MTSVNSLQIIEWQEANFRAVNKFYKRQKHKGSASGDERVFIALGDLPNDSSDPSTEPSIIAAVRLAPADGYYWLRSLYVDKDLRGASIGSQLLAHVNTHVHSTIHCFPYAHLLNFYSQCGYQLSDITQAPAPLQPLYTRYNQKGDGVLFMSRLHE